MMAKKPRVELNHEGFGRMLRGPEIQRMVKASGDRIAARAGGGAEADVWIDPSGRSRKPGGPRAISGVKFPLKVRAGDAEQRAKASVGAGRV